MKKFTNELGYVFNPVNILRDLKSLKRGTKFALIGMLLITIISSVMGGMSFTFIDIATLITSIFMVLNLALVDEGKITNYSLGFISCVGWLMIAIHNKLFGDVYAQIFYIAMQFVGIAVWSKHTNDGDVVESRKLTKVQMILTALLAITLYVIVLFTSKSLNGSQVYIDSLLLPLGIVGQILMSNGYKEQWIVWIGIDMLNVYIWVNQLLTNGLSASTLTFLILQIVMTANAIYGAYLWYKGNE